MAFKPKAPKLAIKKTKNKQLNKTTNHKNLKKGTGLLQKTATKTVLGIFSILIVLGAYFFDLGNKVDEETENIYGGWRIADNETVATIGSDFCNIERRYADELSEEVFEKIYRFKKPVILLFKNGAKDWTEPKRWQLENLKEEYGRWAVNSGNSIEIVRNGGSGNVVTSFTQFLEKLFPKEAPIGDPFYMFDRAFFNDTSLADTLNPPSYLQIKPHTYASIFLLGASRSGVSFHNHGDGWNGVIYGQKRWFIYLKDKAPPGGIYPGFTQTEWHQKVYPNLTDDKKPLECIQRAGELLYLPEGAYHSTLNLGDTIAIAFQTKNFTVDSVKLHYDEQKIQGKMRTEKSESVIKTLIDESREILLSLLEITPENAEIYNRLGMSYMASEEYETAITHFNKAIEIDPYFVLAYMNIGEMYAQMGKNDLAEENLKYATELSPMLWDCYAAYGDFLKHRNRIREAIELYRKGTEVEPTMKPFWKAMRDAQKILGDVEGAKKSQEQMDWLQKVGKGAGIHLARNTTHHHHH
ncbi:hypothetical protein ScPMuIL_007466 [Solemya velum]